ncbi:MAG TPA: HNH endonuclease domain-containing protein [Flavipsychrobacter sp.]|nr:HNH endonuclease domain-containing protein [Flavipsychrobacter sp.]
MKFKHVLGLDIGTNSLGWFLIKEFEDGTIEMVKSGVHVFPIGTIVDDKSNKETTKNEQRRKYRGASRLRYRFKLRRKNLKDILERLGMLPDYSKLFKPLSSEEKEQIQNHERGQSYLLYKLRSEAINSKIPLDEIGRIFMLLNKYRGFKSNRKNQKEDKETGEVKKGIANLQKLIDESGARTIGEYFFKMHEKAKEWYDENKWHNPNEPVDERALNKETGEFVLFNSNGIRRHHGRYTLRDMYLHEFDLIWKAQKEAYKEEKPEIFTGSKEEYDAILSLPHTERIKALKEFRKTNYWHIREYCIYYQRPLKSQKKFVSTCQFERGEYYVMNEKVIGGDTEKIVQKRKWKKKSKKACPKSHPLFQEFRIWQKLHQICYSSSSEEVYNKPLKTGWFPVIADYLMQNKELNLSKPGKNSQEDVQWMSKLLYQNGLVENHEGYTFFIDKADEDVDGDDKNVNKIAGNITYSSFKEALGEETFTQFLNEKITRIENINKETESQVEENRLFLLWNVLHQAKDGLFKEDVWLLSILTDKWKLKVEQASALIEKGLQPDYGSYSSKVLKAILPFMRKGLNEYEALKAAGRGYVNYDNTVGLKVQIKEKISQLAYQELRNPVVERALSKTIKLVNAVLEKYRHEINRETFEIRIESTRALRKPRQERESERRKNAEKDKLREQYAAFLTKNKDKLGFKRDIYKYNSIVAKYELWLQMNMNEDDEVFISGFKAFSKIIKQEDRLKHKLWLECGRRCPYTGAVINFTDCFSPEVEIEHIIPLSRSLDDSFNNKTLTYRATNVLKGSKTPLEFISKLGKEKLKEFRSRMNSKYHGFADSKLMLFLADDIKSVQEFSNSQLSNTSYIARYAVKKMQEICKNVQFTNGAATFQLRSYDWSLSALLDKIRYEEETGVNIDEFYKEYNGIKRDFLNWYSKKVESSDFRRVDALNSDIDKATYLQETNNDLTYWEKEIKAFEEFRNKSGKKDRSDHRHHAVDAFITSCCSPAIVKLMSTYNAVREENDLQNRDKILRRFDYEQLKQFISNILVSHSEKQALIKKRKNRIKTKSGIIEDVTYAPQGSLHKETFYGKLKQPQNQGFSKRNVYVSRSPLLSKNGSTEAYLFESKEAIERDVYEPSKKQVLRNRLDVIAGLEDEKGNKLKPFSEKAMRLFPLYTPTANEDKTKSRKGKSLPVIKSVRTRYQNARSVVEISARKYADKGGNFLMVFYEKEQFDKKGKRRKPVKDFRLLSFWDATKSKRQNEKLFSDEIEDLTLCKHCQWLKKGDLIFLGDKEDEFEKVDWSDTLMISSKLYRINELGYNPTGEGYAVIKVEPHKKMKTSKDKYAANGKFLKLSESLNGIKVRLNILGEIEAKGEECFE